LVCTHVNILPSGAMNRQYCVSSVRVAVPVQSALTVYVPEKGREEEAQRVAEECARVKSKMEI
jgi:hypothetical protein